MSITLGFYDLFANVVPGFIYLFIFNESLRQLGLAHLDVTEIDNLTYFFLLAAFAYLIGHIMDFVAHRVWVRVFYRDHAEERAYRQFRAIYPELQVELNPRHVHLFFDAIKYARPELTNGIERNKVISLMLRNVSFAFILFFITEIAVILLKGFAWTNLAMAIVSLLISIAALRRADLFNVLFYKMVFEHVVLFGNSLEEIVNYHRKSSDQNKPKDKKAPRSARRKNDSS
jgi:hypothetical protein